MFQCYRVGEVDFIQKGKDLVPRYYFLDFLPFVRQLMSPITMVSYQSITQF